MQWKVTLAPGDKTFDIREGETVLQAARRQGIHLAYDCRSGSCGSCCAHLISGQVHYPQGLPLALTTLEMQQGDVLLCRVAPLTDLLLAAQEVTAAAELRVKILLSRVVQLQKLNHDVMAIYLKLPAVERLGFLPGQYLDVLLPGNHRRSFSLANPPHDDALLELHVRLVPGGHFTTEVFSQLHAGALLQIQGPLGTFFLREDSARPILMIAGGAGFAPCKAMLRHAFENRLSRRIAFYWGARGHADLYAQPQAEQWVREQPDFRFVPVLSEPRPGDQWTGRRGLVHEAVLADYTEFSKYDIYLAGPPVMVRSARQSLLLKGADPARIFSDAFDYAPEVRAALEKVTNAP